jgi:hypothetical protein
METLAINQMSMVSAVVYSVLALVAGVVGFFVLLKIAKWVRDGGEGRSSYTGWWYEEHSSDFSGDKIKKVERYYRNGEGTGRIRKSYHNSNH